MSEVVERVAAALRRYDVNGAGSRILARAAIAAMGACPGDDVLRAMMLALTREGTTNVSISATWQAWEDGHAAALSDPSTQSGLPSGGSGDEVRAVTEVAHQRSAPHRELP